MSKHAKTVGIIAEFNPFHNGHQYIMEQARHRTGAEHVIIIMSGNYVQRGTPAILDKFLRTRMALLDGADCVIELPLCYATASANHFAMGAVALLSSLNCVDYLCFGSESGDLNSLNQIADFFTDESESYQTQLKHFLKLGLSFPAARQKAVSSCFSGEPEFFHLLGNPNDVLALEYLTALKKLHSKIQPIAIPRIGSLYHDTQITPMASATAIRQSLLHCDSLHSYENLANSIPSASREILKDVLFSNQFLTIDDFSSLFLPLLFKKEDLSKYYDLSTDLAHRIEKLSNNFISLSQFTSMLKRKNFTYSSIQRSLLHCILELTQKEHDNFFSNGINYYIRVLGFRKEKSFLIKDLKKNASLPVITRLSEYENFFSPNHLQQPDATSYNSLGFQMLQKERYADKLYRNVLMLKKQAYVKTDSEQGVIIL